MPKEPLDIIAEVVEYYRINPGLADLALPQIDQCHLIAKDICDALVAHGYWLDGEGIPHAD